MLTRYTDFINRIENENIIVEILGQGDVQELNEEEAYRFSTYYIGGKFYGNSIQIPEEYRDKLFDIQDDIEKTLYNVNPFDGVHKGNSIEFEIKPTEHWFTKFFRKEFEDSNGVKSYVNPGLYEGINLIKNNADFLANLLGNKTIKDNDYVLLKTKDYSLYNVTISFDMVDDLTYHIIMVSQMKGKGNYLSTNLKVYNVHPKGPLRT